MVVKVIALRKDQMKEARCFGPELNTHDGKFLCLGLGSGIRINLKSCIRTLLASVIIAPWLYTPPHRSPMRSASALTC
jgi:hypothetical protein